uniref:Calponin-homology (CH) domain-containing protein n=1 Tax=Oryza brachyantha TaxID=4533 RepID=J3MLC9_ORYBR
MTPAMAASLRQSLREVCSLEDVTERMGRYMSTEACEEVLVMMCQICKNIDDGRLKMKEQCPLVSDLRLRDKAIRIFMCYNPEWLRIGLHIVLGGDSLIHNGSQKMDKEVAFLKFVLEKQLFAQMTVTKSSAPTKMAEGLCRAGYGEAVGNITLKRIFLLAAALDRAKVESALPLESGIDGLDGGSPLLFCCQTQIKSSRQVVQESLGEVMHGEGDLLMHLTTMGYKLNYQQKVIAPSDTSKKRLHNCTMAIQYMKQAGIRLSDADGLSISAEDITNGDKELVLSLLWNVFISMQLPVLVDQTSVAHELSRLQASASEQPVSETKSQIGLLYDWIQVICAKYGISVESSSQIDRRALNYFINYYLNINIPSFPLKESLSDCRKELFGCCKPDTMAVVTTHPFNNFGEVLAQFLQDLPACDILANDVIFDEKSATILLAFLSSHLTSDRRLEQLKDLINSKLDQQSPVTEVSARRRSRGINDMKCQFPQIDETDGSHISKESTAIVIQTQVRRINAMRKYCKIKNEAQLRHTGHDPVASSSPQKNIADSSSIDSAIKLVCEDDVDCSSDSYQALFYHEHPISTKVNFLFFRKVMAARKIQFAYRRFTHRIFSRISASIKIQSHWRGFSVRTHFKRKIQYIIAIQAVARRVLCHRAFQKQRCASIVIQRIIRGWLARKKLLGSWLPRSCTDLCALDQNQHKISHQSMQLKIMLRSVLRIQRWWRKALLYRSIRISVISIQSFSYVKAYLVRKSSKQEITDIRCRLQKSSEQVDDSMRLINRLIAALSQLTQCRSISSIRQTYATLSMATEYSEKCCQTIVNAGAVEILLKQIHFLNRGVPDQEVLKQVLFTLRNIARFPNLRPVLIHTPQAVATVFQELLRNKADGFFIACDILKRLCEYKEGHEIAQALQHHIRRLGNLVQELEKKVELDRRNGRTGVSKENNLRRLGEAVTLHHLLTNDR